MCNRTIHCDVIYSCHLYHIWKQLILSPPFYETAQDRDASVQVRASHIFELGLLQYRLTGIDNNCDILKNEILLLY